MSCGYAKNVVLGFATNLSPERVEVFSKTLRKVYSSQECDLVIYTNDVNDELCRIAKEYSVNFMYTPNTYSYSVNKLSKFLNRIIIYQTKWLATLTCSFHSLEIIFNKQYSLLLKLWHHPHFVRWLSYQEFLHTHRNYKKIFLSDIKDVAFQSPFFEMLDGSSLHFFEQDQYYGPDNYDTRWYREAYGSKELKRLEGKPSLCIGTIMGDFEGIETFVNSVCVEILKKPFGRIEQTIFNNLYYSNAFDTIATLVHKNADGPVITLSDPLTEKYYKVSSEGVFGLTGQLIPVIHMYDRFQQPYAHFSNILGYEIKGSGLLKN